MAFNCHINHSNRQKDNIESVKHQGWELKNFKHKQKLKTNPNIKGYKVEFIQIKVQTLKNYIQEW